MDGCIQFYGTKQRKGMPGNSEKKNESILGSQAATFNLVSVVEHYDFLRKNGSQCALDMAFLYGWCLETPFKPFRNAKGRG